MLLPAAGLPAASTGSSGAQAAARLSTAGLLHGHVEDAARLASDPLLSNAALRHPQLRVNPGADQDVRAVLFELQSRPASG